MTATRQAPEHFNPKQNNNYYRKLKTKYPLALGSFKVKDCSVDIFEINISLFKVRPSNARTGSLTLQVQCPARHSSEALPTNTAGTSTFRKTAANRTNASALAPPMASDRTDQISVNLWSNERSATPRVFSVMLNHSFQWLCWVLFIISQTLNGGSRLEGRSYLLLACTLRVPHLPPLYTCWSWNTVRLLHRLLFVLVVYSWLPGASFCEIDKQRELVSWYRTRPWPESSTTASS